MIALQNAQKIMDETGCDGVKLEGGEARAETIQLLVNNDIPVMAHVGLLPQAVNDPSGYRVQGRDEDSAAQLISDAEAVQASGAFAVVVEAVPEPLAQEITKKLDIPTIGIGASAACKGQILVTEDLLGQSLGKAPKFVKQYATLSEQTNNAIKSFAAEVRNGDFPAAEHTYKTSPETNLKKAS